MKARLKRYVLTFLVMVIFGFLAWLIGFVANDTLPPRIVTRLRIALMGVGLLATGLVFQYLGKRWKGRIRGEKAAARQDKLKALFRAAHKRLAASPKAQEKSLRKLPTLIVLGPSGATKTTVVEHSGLNTELLEGEIYRGEAVAPTELANLWYAEGSVVLEAGGALLDEPEKWEALLSHTQPARLAAALGFGQQAPRTALVCVGCDEFTQPGATEHVATLARKLRDRLVEAAEALGIRLPVYVLFTRADRLPYYDDFVRALSGDEAARALGATLPLQPETSASAHAEAEGARVTRYLDEVLHALRLKRREFLMRERDAEVQAGVYEFPRELEKIRSHIHRFLVELCRPSQLGRSPFLRGFHFTGVRALVVDEPGAAAASPSLAAPNDSASLGATQVFDQARIQAAAAAARQAAAGRSRRVPDWAFLKPFFQKVLLPDEAARVMTTGGARVDLLRRGLLSIVAVASLVWAVGLVVSWRSNAGTAARVEAAALQVTEAEVPVASIPTREIVERMDSLRERLVELRTWNAEGPPLRMTWGLYKGEAILEPGLLVWLQTFERVLGSQARSLLRDRLAALPPPPGETPEFRSIYDALKAYLILTDHPTRSEVDFLPGAVFADWSAARIQDEDWDGLLERQFAFFADVIREGNPLEQPPDATIVEASRAFLRELSEEDQVYNQVLGDAGTRGQEIRLATAVPGSADYLANDVVVEPHFTLGAFEWVDGVDAAEMLQSEDWVLGGATRAIANIELLGDSVKARYRAAYAQRWIEFLEGTTVRPFGGVADAARRLERLSDSNSPLLATLSLVARNTRPFPDDFQPLLSIYPAPPPTEGEDEAADEDPRLVRDSNEDYVIALRDLRVAMEDVAEADPSGQQAAAQAANDRVQAGEGAVVAMSDRFIRESAVAGRAADAVRGLLEEPLRRSRALLGNIGPAQINGSGRSFCRQFDELLGGYPFQRGASAPADIADVVAALHPDEGLLWAFVDEQLESRGLVRRQANRYVATGNDPQPTAAFLRFVNEAWAFSGALFDQGRPEVAFSLLPETTDVLSRISIRVDNVEQNTTPTDQGRATFVWNGERAREVMVVAQIGGETVPLLTATPGTWALFRIFETADWRDVGGNVYELTWNNTGGGQALRAELRLPVSPAVFRRSVLDQLSCVPQIVR